jgi:hypothetical protein
MVCCKLLYIIYVNIRALHLGPLVANVEIALSVIQVWNSGLSKNEDGSFDCISI